MNRLQRGKVFSSAEEVADLLDYGFGIVVTRYDDRIVIYNDPKNLRVCDDKISQCQELSNNLSGAAVSHGNAILIRNDGKSGCDRKKASIICHECVRGLPPDAKKINNDALISVLVWNP